ncbi:MAG: chemotaxis protein CheW [Opitutales bacterium]
MSASTATETATETKKNTHRATVAEKYLTFTLGAETYGLAVLRIKEIIQHQQITAVPQVPSYIKGVLNLRGKVIPVIDMRVKFCLGHEQVDERTCIIVVQVQCENRGQVLVGLIVDAVEEVLNINAAQIEEKPDLGGRVDNQFIHGIAKVEGKVKTLLDIETIILGENMQF